MGAKVRKTYDTARTPAQRLLSRSDVPRNTKKSLRDNFRQLKVAQLLRDINRLIRQLYQT